MRGWFEEGAGKIAADERERGVGGVVHGDYKLDNMVNTLLTVPRVTTAEIELDRSSILQKTE